MGPENTDTVHVNTQVIAFSKHVLAINSDTSSEPVPNGTTSTLFFSKYAATTGATVPFILVIIALIFSSFQVS